MQFILMEEDEDWPYISCYNILTRHGIRVVRCLAMLLGWLGLLVALPLAASN